MHPKPLFQAVVCVACQQASLVPFEPAGTHPCASCGGPRGAVAGARYIAADLPLFAQLEGLVRSANLSLYEATSMALELESVSLRWEPPELVLERIGERLRGLQGLWDRKQEYSQLLLVVSILLTAVFARMNATSHLPRRNRHASGIYRIGFDSELAGVLSARPDKQR